jgi:diguanylate cyclase (GGDEF)-like protein
MGGDAMISEAHAVTSRRHTILVADARPGDLIVVAGQLRALGYNVILAEGVTGALQHLAQARPDLILLDATLPDMEGLEVCRRARAGLDPIPVILVTGRKQTGARLPAYGPGVADYIAKPLQAHEVAARVATHLRLCAMHAQMRRQTRQLRQLRRNLLRRDSLTGLPNRRSFQDSLTQALGRAQASGGELGVLLLGLDHFRDVNDGLGRTNGDRLLLSRAMLFQQVVGVADLVARTGGDEFAVLVEAPGDDAALAGLAQRLLRRLAKPVDIGGHELAVGCSIGVIRAPRDGLDAETLLCNVETAMYRAKAEGRNRYRHFTTEMGRSTRRRVDVGNALRHAIRHAELSLHYQPRTSLGEGKVAGMEALLRWNGQLLGPVAPAEFIPLAEQNGLILQIGEWVLHQACHQARNGAGGSANRCRSPSTCRRASSTTPTWYASSRPR